jgi:hypothetical protein
LREPVAAVYDYPSRDPRPLAGAAPLGLGVLIALGGILVMMSCAWI